MHDRLNEQRDVLNSLVNEITQYDPESNLSVEGLSSGDRLWILGAGKAAVRQAEALIRLYEPEIADGILITNSGESAPDGLQVFEGSHPHPTEDTVAASYELLELAKAIPEGEKVVFLLSGGASAMLTIPPEGIETEELAETHRLLLESGADIHAMNTVRKHLCILKGGQLAQYLHHVSLFSLISSDVPGNDLTVIGSGPTVSDPTTFKDAFQVLKRYELWTKVPHAVRIHIAKGMEGRYPDTPKPGIQDHPDHQTVLVSAADRLARFAGQQLKDQGYSVRVADMAYSEDVRVVSKQICQQVIGILNNQDDLKKPAALIWYGESSVHVTGDGKGGRNQELALAAAISLEGQHPVSLLSMGTDGIDGPTDAAGAIVNSATTLKARKQKLEPEAFLSDNDAYHFHEQAGTLIKTGKTGINLMDLQVALVG